MNSFRIFIGYDPKEAIAYHTLCHSILSRATEPVSITPVTRLGLSGVYRRERGPTESTDFSLTRFLTPYLSGYEGWSLFMDSDMLVQCDITDLSLDITTNPEKSVLVCQHDYTPKTLSKMDGQLQTRYPRKNWSSFMLMNNARCKALTPEYVNAATGLELHRFSWLRDAEIGALPLDWNWLVGEYPPNPNARVLHYTLGIPEMPGCELLGHAEEWFNEKAQALGQAHGVTKAGSQGDEKAGPESNPPICEVPLAHPAGDPAVTGSSHILERQAL